MAAYDPTRPVAEAFPAMLAMSVVRVAASFNRNWKNRRQFRRLLDMTDRELADIGIDRDDLREAWRRRVELDPTAHLNLLARSRDSLAFDSLAHDSLARDSLEGAARRVA